MARYLYHSSWLLYAMALLLPLNEHWGAGLKIMLFSFIALPLLLSSVSIDQWQAVPSLLLPLFNLPYWHSLLWRAEVATLFSYVLALGGLLSLPWIVKTPEFYPLLLWSLALGCMALSIGHRHRTSAS